MSNNEYWRGVKQVCLRSGADFEKVAQGLLSRSAAAPFNFIARQQTKSWLRKPENQASGGVLRDRYNVPAAPIAPVSRAVKPNHTTYGASARPGFGSVPQNPISDYYSGRSTDANIRRSLGPYANGL